MDHAIQFFVPGTPVPKGSAKAFYNKHLGRAQVMQDNREKQKPWASLISFYAQRQMSSPTLAGPVRLSLEFTMPRLKAHFGTGKNSRSLKQNAPTWHISKPDLDKLVRCVKDALTGIVWNDDSQVCELGKVRKVYGEQPGVLVKVEAL
ncbi:MAG: RusA family crossover junction endodeoxyribonuclease [Desulfuromonadales bacterium]|nr:RusA family crossover junction endodeoxyribonuclease [Desulfuromonadales bacterium]